MEGKIEFRRGDTDQVIVIPKSLVLGTWGYVLGNDGLALYCLYKCLADEGQCGSLAEIESHLKCTRNNIMRLNRLLELAGMVKVIPGNNRTPNSFEVYNPPNPTEDLFLQIAIRLKADQWMARDYNVAARDAFVERLTTPRPFGLVPRPARREPVMVEPEEDEPDGNDLAGELSEFDPRLTEEEIKNLLENYTPDHLRSWMFTIENMKNIRSGRAYLLKVVDQPPPRNGGKRKDLSNQIPPELRDIIKR